MDESYLSEIKRRVKVEQSEMNRLAAFKAVLTKQVNDLRNQKEEGERVMKEFTKDQVNVSSKKIKESREKLEEELKRNEEHIRGINRKARKIQEQQEVTTEGLRRVNEREQELKEKAREMRDIKEKAKNTLDKARITAAQAKSNREASRENKKITDKAVKEAIRKLDNVVEYEKERMKVMEEKSRMLSSQYKLTRVKEELMNDGLEWVKDQRIKIEDQWGQLLRAKQYI